MTRTANLIVAGSAAARLACVDAATDPPDGDRGPEQITLPELIASEATSTSTAASSVATGSEWAYVSLPPGTLTDVATARLRNKTTGGSPTPAILLIDGGFDPVAVVASEGDEIEAQFIYTDGNVTVAYVKVPARRPPRIVRTAPPAGRTDVALSIRPEVIFTEPIDPRTVSRASVRLLVGGTQVDGEVGLSLAQPWVAVFGPATPLQPGTRYELMITQDVRDMQGEGLESPLSLTFTTGAFSSSLAGIYARVSPSYIPGSSRYVFDENGRFSLQYSRPDYGYSSTAAGTRPLVPQPHSTSATGTLNGGRGKRAGRSAKTHSSSSTTSG